MKENNMFETEEDFISNASDIENNDESEEIISPFDPKLISLETKPLSLEQIIGRIKRGTLDLQPPFQRAFIWDETKQSRLIESLMLRIPLPMFYFSADIAGSYQVVDGLQRLNTLYNFIEKKKSFKLKNLEFWKEHENKTFTELEPYLQNRILETTMQVTIINPSTPENVKRNVFKRINTGGYPLSSQEIRHALYEGKSTELLKSLVDNKDFKTVMGNKFKDLRMAGREIILRFLSFYINKPAEYKIVDMDEWLSKTMQIINKYNDHQIKELENIFIKAVRRAYIIFSDYAFRKSLPNNKKTPINKTLFEVWCFALVSLSDEEFGILTKNKNTLIEKLKILYETNRFQISVSRDSWKVESVKYRYENVASVINLITGGKLCLF
ncbi:MAG: DUF262 domain-containing protein [Candidatus Mucispirillum faecigallinarum]|nr:DUF262 domain-containing protein [Candidatus Mucispirillum faecigallinarum]